jgi:hypothetical protein
MARRTAYQLCDAVEVVANVRNCAQTLPSNESQARPLAPLAPEQQCEAVIERGLSGFIEVGSALLKIRDSRLYRQSFRTFEQYCRERWGMVASRARQLCLAAEAVNNLESVTNVTPANEAQARPLAPLAPEQQREAWSRAVETAPNGHPTAAHVKGPCR